MTAQPQGSPQAPALTLAATPASSTVAARLDALLRTMVDAGASDLHLTAGAPPCMRVRGRLTPIEGETQLATADLEGFATCIVSSEQRREFEDRLELDSSYTVAGLARFRVNLFRQRSSIAAVLRFVAWEIPSLGNLGMPESVATFAELPRGLVLVTGPTGSGKSTTLASIIDRINTTRSDHIVTIEDPIEFLHKNRRCLVNQREIGSDTHSFAEALKHVLRQDPDVILIGELRDLETISVALTAAETGHLVFATLHTQDAAQTVDRLINVFPPHQQQQVRVQVASVLQGVICQTLLPTADGTGRAAAAEVLVATPAVRNLIREGKVHQIPSAMQAGLKFGMQTMDHDIAALVRRGKVSRETAFSKCHDAEELQRLLDRAGMVR